MTDSELLRQFAHDGSEGAFAELVRRRINFVYSAALRQLAGDTHRAEDVTQEVFTDLARKAASLVRHPELLGWLYTSTHFATLNSIRTEQRRRRREEEAHAMTHANDANADAADQVNPEKLYRVLDAAMHELDERDRQLVLLRFFDQRPFAAIGAALGLSENAAQKSTDRALDKLHAALSRRGITSTSAALSMALGSSVAATTPTGLAANITSAALAGTSAGLAGLFTLMSTTKITLAVTGAIAAVAIGLFLHERQKTGASTAAQETTPLVLEVSAGRKHNAAGQSAMRSTEQALPPQVDNALEKRSRLMETAAEAWQRAVLSLTAEDVRAYTDRKRRWWSIASIQRFLERANLPSEKAEELKSALVDKAMLDYELRVSARQMGLSTDSSAYANMRAAEEQRLKDRITSLVDEKYYKMIDGQLEMNAFLIYSCETFAQAYEDGVPFSPEQRKTFEDIQKQLNRGNKRFTEYPVDPATGFTHYDEEMFRLVSGLLSAEQMDVFKRMRKEFNLFRDNYRQVPEHYDIFHGKLPQPR